MTLTPEAAMIGDFGNRDVTVGTSPPTPTLEEVVAEVEEVMIEAEAEIFGLAAFMAA